jgi:serine/threonine protein kinase
MIQKIEPGDVIGRCRTIRELGRGGVGAVYLATHQTLQIEVAIKVLSPALSMDNPGLAERFIREAQLAARIRHPNVIAVMDAAHDETTGLYYIVMEYVGGGSLSWHLRNGPLPEAKALAITTGIAHALVIAEENRIVHRDIKPENIMLDLRGTAKLADLGLAKHSLDSRVSLTMGGSFMGTPAYMSPEQARDAKIADTRDDIYSLGASFYECLTGEPPFKGETPYNIMSELLTKPSPRPRALRHGLSRSADLICRKMMAKTRDLRYPDARALLQDLQHAQIYGDAGLEGLDAVSFDQDAVSMHRQEQSYGIETSSDGVYAGEEQPDVPVLNRPVRPAPVPPPRRSDNDVFGAAALLIALVLVTTLFIAWAGPNHPLAFLQNKFAQLSGTTAPVVQAPPPSKPGKETKPVHIATPKTVAPIKISDHTTSDSPAEKTPSHPVTVTPKAEPVTPTSPVALPVALPVNPTDLTDAAPLNPTSAVTPVPAVAAIPQSAFAARDIAEKSLDASIVAPTGHAELLKVSSKHDPDLITPATWTFFFFDKEAAGHARIVTVKDGAVVKNGEYPLAFASPYTDADILPEDKLQKDSTDALQIAESLIPGATVTSSEFTLVQQRNSLPLWKVTLWTKNASGEEHRLGDVTLRADNGALGAINLKP